MAPVISTPVPRTPETSRGSVLIVDASRAGAFLLSRVAQRCGFVPTVAVDTVAELEALSGAATPFDTVLLDASLAGAKHLADAVERPATRLVGLGAAREDDADWLSGLDARLPRPVEFSELARILAEAADAKAHALEAEPAAQPVDLRALRDLEKLGGADFVRDIVNQFVADGAAALRNLSHSMATGDVGLFRDQAHALRSSAANVGARSIYSTCLAWREIAEDDLVRNGVDHMRELGEQFDNASRTLTAYIETVRREEEAERREPPSAAA